MDTVVNARQQQIVMSSRGASSPSSPSSSSSLVHCSDALSLCVSVCLLWDDVIGKSEAVCFINSFIHYSEWWRDRVPVVTSSGKEARSHCERARSPSVTQRAPLIRGRDPVIPSKPRETVQCLRGTADRREL